MFMLVSRKLHDLLDFRQFYLHNESSFLFFQPVTDLLTCKETALESQTTTVWNKQLSLGLILNKTMPFVL